MIQKQYRAMNEHGFYLISVQAKPMGEFYHTHSPDLPGICLLGRDVNKLFKSIPEIIEKLFKLNLGINVKAEEIVL